MIFYSLTIDQRIMLKKPGSFSNRYMSNPIPQAMNFRQVNKENKAHINTYHNNTSNQLNNEINQDFNFGLSEHTKHTQPKKDDRSVSYKVIKKSDSKLKLQWQKYERQLNADVLKHKKEVQRLRQQVKKIQKSNQQNICSYQNYIKQIQCQRDQMFKKSKAYREQLKICIIWIIEAYSLAQNPKRLSQLIHSKMNKQKMGLLLHKLSNTIEQLELERTLSEIALHEEANEDYLIYDRQSVGKNHNLGSVNPEPMSELEQINDMLDTFSLNKESMLPSEKALQVQIPTLTQQSNLARRLFVNEDTFGEEIGEHEISEEQSQFNTGQNAFVRSESSLSRSTRKDKPNYSSGDIVKIRSQINQQKNEDFLPVKIGQQIKLLRKVGDLWIAEHGTKIGYIPECIFS